MNKYCLTIYCILILHFAAFTQQLQVISYTDREGYPSNSCKYIMQDRQGWMWFSAAYQVLRFDGHRFKKYPPASGVVLHFVFNLFEVGEEIWINAIPYMLKVDGDSLRRLDIKNNYPLPNAGTFDISDHLLNKGKHHFLCKNGLYYLQNKELKPIISDSSINLSRGGNLCVYNDSLLLAHVKEGNSLIAFDLKQKKFHVLSKNIMGIKERNGKIYLCKQGEGIFVIEAIKIKNDAPELETRLVTAFKPRESIIKFDIDGQGNFWLFYTNEKIFRIKPGGQVQLISEQEGLRDMFYLYSFADREHNFWIASLSSLLKIPGQHWERFTKSDSLLSNLVTDIHPGFKRGQVFIQTANGINFYDDNEIKTIRKNGKPFIANYIRNMGSRIFYFWNNQFFAAELDTSTFKIKNEKLLAQFPMPIISVTYDDRNNFYLSTHEGFYWFAEGKIKRLGNQSYKKLFTDSQGNIWAGKFFNELDCFRVTFNSNYPQLDRLFKLDSINNTMPRINAIRAIAESPGGYIFVGTRYDGLFIITIKNDSISHVRHLGKQQGLEANHVWDLSFDYLGHLWIGTSGGISSMHLKEGNWILSEESKRRQIKGTDAILAAADNKIWANSYPGIIAFNPDRNEEMFPFSVTITGIKVNGKNFSPNEANKFNYNENDISIEFSANTYRFDHEVAYSWWLSEKNNWSELSNNHSINFSELKAGTYTFNVKARDAFGQWSENKAGFQFTILAPLWQQAWFIALIFLLVLSILYLLYRYRIQQIKKVENLRHHIARDLHDDIGSTLTSISILSKVSRMNLKSDQQKSDELLSRVIDQSQRMQQNMSDIVWTIKPDNDRMKNMVAHMREYLAQTLEPADISIHFSVDEPLLHRTLGMEVRRDFFLIFKEAVNNVTRHSQAKNVFINLNLQNEMIQLKVCDDGAGICDTKIEGGNGLQNMKERADALKGKLQIYNGENGGCCLELKIPAG